MTHTKTSPNLPHSDALEPWHLNSYQLPPHLELVDTEVVEGEFIYDVEPRTIGRRTEWFIYATLVEDAPAQNVRELESSVEISDETPLPLEDASVPESERPVGVRVQWKRPTELFAEFGAYAAGKGMDFTAALSERLVKRASTPNKQSAPTQPTFERLNPYANHDYRAHTPASPETIHL
ncbi:hypothetical protein G7066_08840 [Leucobacter coleopterorum]|uniref:Polyketide cyclase / dehydrase and lipid transport n=1 Tax=Leucobacter coleopterorum TaxID=2714933 RepID=A0ABX6K0S9_9MICO|nr:hypothetical protein [Leucobacter coleopterorum]QIM18689.1 hypothetical protein G7066_08840 [Leucobacter coleopterorum]